MKKKITQPDGTVIEIEGTAEELAELERKSSGDDRKDESKKKGPRILNEETVAAAAGESLATHERTRPHLLQN